jgi:CHAD domain-containing protein
MADGKWITGLKPTMPAAEAARLVLQVRLEVVREHLPRALREADRDVEHIHQLRVATRRAGAALRLFADYLPEKAYDQARRGLRRLRRAAGAARDWDVFRLGLDDWRAQRTDLEYPGLDCLLGYVVALRAEAQEALRQAEAARPLVFDRLAAATQAAIRPPRPERSLEAVARPLLLDLAQELHEATSGNLSSYEHLHRVRIAGKRLRYAMEVFAVCIEPALRERAYVAVEELQEILGRANDSHVARRRLRSLRDALRRTTVWKRLKPGLEGLLRYHDRRLPQERQRFLGWLASWRDGGTEAALLTVLRRPLALAQ